MSWQLVQWAMESAPMLATERCKNDTTARFVLVALAEKARGEESRAWPSIATIRYMTGLDREVIRRALRRLADGGLITDVGRRGDGVVCWRLNTDQVRPDTDLKAIEAEVEERKEKDRLRKQAARSTQDVSTVLSLDSEPVSELKTADSTVLSRESTVLRLDSTVQHSTEPDRTGNEPVSEPVPAEQASAEAPAPDDTVILDAEIVDEEPATELFEAPKAPPKRTRRKKPVDPEKQARLDQAQDLADRYYRSKNRMVKFMAVRGIVLKALENYPYEVVFEGVKRMATVDRDRPFTLDTLRSAIERGSGVGPATARSGGDPLAHLAPGDQIQVRTEFLKSRPNWDRLATYGITPDNAALFGFKAS